MVQITFNISTEAYELSTAIRICKAIYTYMSGSGSGNPAQHVRGLVFDCQCHEQGAEAPERVQQNAPWWGSRDGARGDKQGPWGP